VLRKLKLLPGVNLEQTPTLNQTQLTASNLIRFYGGLVQKLGGWAHLSLSALTGVCRGLHGWADIIGNAYLAAGTEQRLQLLIGGTLYDITPLADTTSPAVSFSTVMGTAAVTIDDAGYSPNAGDWINLTVYVSAGGLVLYGYYQVQSSASPTYVITAAGNATATVTNGGAVPVFTTTNGHATVSVALAAHGFVAGAMFTVGVPTTVGGITLSGLYNVTSVTSANAFVITALTTATSSTSGSENGGNAQIEYLLPTGYAVNTPLVGYGIGNYGAGDYGLAGTDASTALLRQWSLDHFGQDLIASPSNGAIYYWSPPTIEPAAVLSDTAPLYSTAVFVMPQVEIIVAIGAETGGTQEPLLIRWCDQADFTDWTASATNQAGSFSIPTGTKLVGGLAVGLEALLWTDAGLWTMAYLGFPLVFGFNQASVACGLVSQRAAGAWGTSVMWISTRGFFQYSISGSVTPVECPVWDFILNNIDITQLGQVHCAPNALFNELCWFFPLLVTSPLWNALAPLAYVKFNYVENAWDYGLSPQYQRTAWIGVSPVGYPVGADGAGLLQQHEVSTDADGQGMMWSWQSGFFDLAEGEDFVFSDLIIPDFITIGAPTFVPNVLSTDYPNAPSTQVVTPNITAASNWITYSARGRQLSVGMSGSDLGTFFRLGALRVRAAPDGRN
jgi:hypothetical protein